MRTGLPFDDVLAAAQAGAAWAFEALYRDLVPAVTGYLRLHGAAEPDDLASETFLGVFTGLAGFRGRRGGAARLGLHHRPPPPDRRLAAAQPSAAAGRRRASTTSPDAVGGDVEDDALARFGAEDVHRLCAALPDDQRAVLLLRILADLTVEQVAQVMGRSAALGQGAPAARAADAAGRSSSRAPPKGWAPPRTPFRPRRR